MLSARRVADRHVSAHRRVVLVGVKRPQLLDVRTIDHAVR